MKVNLNLSTSHSQLKALENVNKTNAVMTQSATATAPNYGVISFAGAKNPEQVLLVTAETKPYFQIGGVATVVEQYPEHVFNGAKNTPIMMPYYNGMLKYDKAGNPVDVSILMKDGKPIMTNENLKKVPVDKLAPNKYWELEKVADKTMDYAGHKEPISVYKIKGKEHYVVYTKETAMMPKPYADGSYSSEMKKYLGKNRDAYAKFNKAVVELLPDMETKGMNPRAIVMNDGQAAYLPEYIAQSVKNGKGEYFKNMNLSYVQHNLGAGYQQIQSARQMFLNFATNEQIEAVMKDPKYIETLKRIPGEGEAVLEEYFKPMVKQFMDADKKISASTIPIQFAKKGNIAHINTVSEMYLANALKNPTVAPGLQADLKLLSEKGVLSGILNGMSPSAGPENPIKIRVGDKVETPFKTFNPSDDVDKIAAIRKENKGILLDRFAKAGSDPKAIAVAEGVDPNRVKNVYGSIDASIVEAVKKGDDIKLFTSWGRGDLQKGLDNVLEAFEKLAQTPEGKKSVLIVAAGLEPGSEEGNNIIKILNRMAENPELKGRYVFVDGFGNANAFSISADANIFPSRFAPCELTDLESMKYGASTIVTDIEGLSQKNFDVRDGLDKATGYKVKTNFNMLPEEFEKVSPEFKEKYQALVKKFERNIADKELELKLANADTACIAKMKAELEETVKKSDDFKKLWRETMDKQIVSELAEAMTLKINESPEVSKKLIRNTLDMKAMWENNDALHGDIMKSAKQLYKERHLDAKMITPDKPLFQFDEAIFKRAKNATSAPAGAPAAVMLNAISATDNTLKDVTAFNGWNVKQAANSAMDSTKNLISEATTYTKNIMNGSIGKKIALATVGVLAAGTGLYYMFKPENTETKHASTYIA